MSDDMTDGMEYREQEPLTAEEEAKLNALQKQVADAHEKYRQWMRDVGNRVPVKKVTMTATVSGDTVRRLVYLTTVLPDCSPMTASEVIAHVIQMGIDAAYERMQRGRSGNMLKLAMLSQLPPEMRQSVITTEMREILRQSDEKNGKAEGDGTLQMDAGNVPPKPAAKVAAPAGGTCAYCKGPLGNAPVERNGKRYCQSDCLLDAMAKECRE